MGTNLAVIMASSTPPEDGIGAAGLPEEPASLTTDGRQLRRERNREAVVEALLDLYRDGNLRPSTEEIAQRSGVSPRSLFRYFDDVDDLTRTAMKRQEERALPLVFIDASTDLPLTERVEALVSQRFELFNAIGNAASVSRLRAPFQPVLAEELTRNRRYLRGQIRTLFEPELSALETSGAAAVLAAVDVLTSFESWKLLTDDQRLAPDVAHAVISSSVVLLLEARS
jgi:AcrR family transcriptional regulator